MVQALADPEVKIISPPLGNSISPPFINSEDNKDDEHDAAGHPANKAVDDDEDEPTLDPAQSIASGGDSGDGSSGDDSGVGSGDNSD